MLPIIYPYNMTSKSSRALAKNLNCLRVYPNRNYRPRNNHLIINWGNSQEPTWGQMELLEQDYFINLNGAKLLNSWEYVQTACNKYEALSRLADCDVQVPDFKVYKEDAVFWTEHGHKVFCRTTLSGHSGRGIIIASTPEELVSASLYTRSINKKDEYRVHVFNGQIIDYQQKKKKLDFDGIFNPEIRNHGNGWIFARENVILPDNVAEQAIKAVTTLGLDFGAVDICTEEETLKAYVFEVNTAPGLVGTTLIKYTETIKRLL